jgi:CHASE3 domain sensor protein
MFKKLTLARRIIFGFVAVIGMMGLATLAANYALNVSQRSLLDVTNIEAVKIRDVGRMVQSLVALQRDEKNFILSKTQIEMDVHEKHIAMDVELLTRLLSRTKDLVDTEGLDLLRKFEQQYTAFRYTQKNVIALSRENANIRARDLSQGDGREA